MATQTVNPDGQVVSVWYIRAGATFKRRYRWSTRDPNAPSSPPQPVNLTGWKAYSQIRVKATDTAALLSLSTDTGEIALNESGDGYIDITLTDAQTALLFSQPKAIFDLELVNPDGSYVRNLFGGPVVISPSVTRR